MMKGYTTFPSYCSLIRLMPTIGGLMVLKHAHAQLEFARGNYGIGTYNTVDISLFKKNSDVDVTYP